MVTETAHDFPIADKPTSNDAQSDSGVESAAPATSSSPTLAATKMVDRKVPGISDFFKKTTVTEEERLAYHRFNWLTGNLISMITEVDVLTVHDSTIVYFKSYLIAGLGLPPSKFLSSIMNFLGCKLVHFNPNAIIVLSYFAMLCECWLGIAPDTSLFDTSILRSDTPRLFIWGSGCHFVVTAVSNISMLPLRVSRRTLRRNGSWWICMSSRSG
jgi:hypothetical protein